MDAKNLRSEFLTLSKTYPELHHALVIWRLRPEDDWFTQLDDWPPFKNDGVSVVANESMTNDTRAESFYLWQGDVDQQRVEIALSALRTWAETAAKCIGLREFRDRIVPEFSVTVSNCSIDRVTGFSRGTKRGSRHGVCDWLGHVFEVVSIDPEELDWHDMEDPKHKVLRSCEVLRLPVNTFEASAWALGSMSDGVEEITGGLPAQQVHKRYKPGPCPECKSTDTKTRNTGGVVRSLECKKCGHTWKESKRS